MSISLAINNVQTAEWFTSIFQHARLFTEHMNIMFEPNRMYIQSMDATRVSIFEVYLPAEWFCKYEHSGDSTVTIGVHSTMLFKILNTREKNQSLNIKFNSNDDEKLYLHFNSEDKTVFDKNFEMPLMDIENELMAIPESDSDAEFSISSANFANIVNQMKLFGDTIEINCSEEIVELLSISQEAGKMTVNIDIDELTSYSINEGEQLHLSFSLHILHNICQYNKISKEMEIHLKENFPLKLIYHLGNNVPGAKLVFYLAPKIEDN
jgi:proliferating cell nuclear antigen PCNA